MPRETLRQGTRIRYYSKTHLVALSNVDLITMFCGKSAWRQDVSEQVDGGTCPTCLAEQVRHKAGETIGVFK